MKIKYLLLLLLLNVGCLSAEKRKAYRPLIKAGAKAGIKQAAKYALKEGKITEKDYKKIEEVLKK